jgi:hypothetical protein
MKAPIGVDLDFRLVHTVLTTPANVNDMTQAHDLLHGQETVAFGDAGYQGVDKRRENQDSPVIWQVAMRPGARRALPDDEVRSTQAAHRARQGRPAGQGRAPVPHPQEPVPVPQDALSGPGQEQRAGHDPVWPRESGTGELAVARVPPFVRPEGG